MSVERLAPPTCQLTACTTYVFNHLLMNCYADVVYTSKDFLESYSAL